MRVWGDGGGSGAEDQEGILNMSFVRKGDFIKAGTGTLGRKSCTGVVTNGYFILGRQRSKVKMEGYRGTSICQGGFKTS